jgi:hypothetical protein
MAFPVLTSGLRVSFSQGSQDQIISHLCNLKAPHIVLWYIGCYGLKKEGVEFYKNFLINPLLSMKPDATFWLVDLTAWGAFKQGLGSIEKTNSCCTLLDQMADRKIRCIRSSQIFERMHSLRSLEDIQYFRMALSREFVARESLDFSLSSRKLKDVFPKESWIAETYPDLDAAKSYSMFQYLEGCFIIDEIARACPDRSELEIAFVLPNNELDYYRDPTNAFEQDANYLLSKHLDPVDVSVRFFSFDYGTCKKHRPYNAPGKTVKKNHLSFEDITGTL